MSTPESLSLKNRCPKRSEAVVHLCVDVRGASVSPRLSVGRRAWACAVMITVALAVAAVLFSAGGCQMEYRVVSSGWDDFPQDPAPADDEALSDGGRSWAVVLHQFTGPRHDEEARRLLRRLEQERGIDDLWIGRTGEMSTVYRGRFSDQSRARRALQRGRAGFLR